VDFGEAADEKFFIIVEVGRGLAEVEWRRLEGIRPLIDCYATLEDATDVTPRILVELPDAMALEGAIVRLIISYPRDCETLIDEEALRRHTAKAFEFHLIKRPRIDGRIRLSADQAVASLSPLELLDLYWAAAKVDGEAAQALNHLAEEIVRQYEP
jgi:exonuclease SbcD